jgi:hypothetical protein
MLDRPQWPLCDTKRNAEGVHIVKKLVKTTRNLLRMQQQWAKADAEKCSRDIFGQHERRAIGVCWNNGAFHGLDCALSALTDPLDRSVYKTPEARRQVADLFHRMRTEPQYRHLRLHPRLP